MATREELISLLGQNSYGVMEQLSDFIETNYEMDKLWNKGGKYGVYELKYRKSGKTLCTLYLREKCFGCWIIFGKDERVKFENKKDDFSLYTQEIYDNTAVFHDGKWIMFEINDDRFTEDIKEMLFIKKKPNKRTK